MLEKDENLRQDLQNSGYNFEVYDSTLNDYVEPEDSIQTCNKM